MKLHAELTAINNCTNYSNTELLDANSEQDNRASLSDL